MEKKHNLLETESIPTLLKKLSIPATIGMIVNALYNLVDTIFIGQGVGSQAIGGLAIAFPIQMVIMAIAMMIGIGAASAVSRSLGEHNQEKADHIAGNAYLLIIILSTAFVIFGLSNTDILLKIFGATDTLLPYARDYIRIIFIGSIIFSFVMASNNLIRSEGNAKDAMVSMLIGTIINILLDPIFIFIFKMGIKGAALATIISQFMSFLYILHYMKSGKSHLKIKFHHLKPNFKYIKEIIVVGFPAFVRQVGGSVLAIFLNNSLGFYGGDIAISAYGIVNRLILFIFMPMFGVVQGLQPIAGYNYGARKYERIEETIKISIKFLIIYATVGWSLSLIFSSNIGFIFTNDKVVVAEVSRLMKFVTLMLPIVGIQIVSGTIFQAFGKAIPAITLSLLRQIILLIPLIIILPKILNLGIWGIYIAFPLSDFISTIVSFILLKKELSNLKIRFSKPINAEA